MQQPSIRQPSDVLMVLGDGPSLPSGLARIARELCLNFYGNTRSDWSPLPLELVQLGVGEPCWGALNYPWTVIPIRNQDDWGGADLMKVLVQERFKGSRITLLTVFDPARCVEVVQALGCRTFNEKVHPAAEVVDKITLAGYFAVDAEGCYPGGGFGGPAADALGVYDHIAAYTEFGRRVLVASMARGAEVDAHDAIRKAVRVLPHGILPGWFEEPSPTAWEALQERNRAIKDWLELDCPGIGCVATNQPRKDLALFFGAVAECDRVYGPVKAWLHTDYAIGPAWSVPELIAAYCTGMRGRVLVTAAEGWSTRGEREPYAVPYTDEELKVLYHSCAVTVAPGLGEGWGYPIVESQACGVPVVGIDYAGGAALLSERVLPAMWRVEGAYLLRRPVVSYRAFVPLLRQFLIDGGRYEPTRDTERACARRWAWDVIWPQWEAWLKEITGRGMGQEHLAQPDEVPRG